MSLIIFVMQQAAGTPISEVVRGPGRVDLSCLTPQERQGFQLTEQSRGANGSPYYDIHYVIEHQQAPTPLSQVFFSAYNVRIVQNRIRHGVWVRSGRQTVIGPQSMDHLANVMRDIFLANALYMPTCISKQVDDLNDLVVQYAVEVIWTKLEQQAAFLEVVSTAPESRIDPVHTSSKGDNSLMFPTWP